MADIKSSFEIAMERAAAIAGGGKDELAREEGKSQGRVLARKLINGALDAEGVAAGLEGISGPGLIAAREAAAEMLLGALEKNGPPALEALQAICRQAGASEQAKALRMAVSQLEEAGSEIDRQLALGVGRLLQASGISGSAVIPNPRALADYDERAAEAVAGLRASLEQAGQALLQKLRE